MSVSAYAYGVVAAAGAVKPEVNATANGDANIANTTCYVGIQFNSNKTEYERNADTGSYNVNIGTWLTLGSPDQVWVKFVKTTGNTIFDSTTSGTVYSLASGRSFGFSWTNTLFPGTCTGYFVFYDNAGGTGTPLQTTSTVTWSATAE